MAMFSCNCYSESCIIEAALINKVFISHFPWWFSLISSLIVLFLQTRPVPWAPVFVCSQEQQPQPPHIGPLIASVVGLKKENLWLPTGCGQGLQLMCAAQSTYTSATEMLALSGQTYLNWEAGKYGLNRYSTHPNNEIVLYLCKEMYKNDILIVN